MRIKRKRKKIVKLEYDEKFDNFLHCVSESVFVTKPRVLTVLKMLYVLSLYKNKKRRRSVGVVVNGLGLVRFRKGRKSRLMVTVDFDDEISGFILGGELNEEKVKRLFA